MTKQTILTQAEIVVEERRKAYGEPIASKKTVAKHWSVTLGLEVTSIEVVLCLIDQKLARLAHHPNHHDSIFDVIGYAALLSEVAP